MLLHQLILAFLLCAAYAYFVPPPSPEKFGTNNSVRFYLAKSLVCDGSFAIEKYYQGGIDAAYFNGHYYSGKAPAASFLGVPVYWCAARLASGLWVFPDWVLLYIVQIMVVSLPSVILALLLHNFLLRFEVSEIYTDLLVVGYSLGTMAYPYSTQFVGHQLSAVFIFTCFMALLKWRREINLAVSPTRRLAPSLLLWAGLLGGLAVAADYQVLLILVVIFLCAVFSLRRPANAVLFALGCLPGIVMILAYNYACFGNILSFPYAHEAMPIAREVQGQGLFGVRMPGLIPFLMLLVSPFRGLFFVSPFLVLALPGLYLLARRCDAGDITEQNVGINSRSLFWVCLVAGIGYVLFISSYTAWAGGAAYGPRFLVPAIPFFVLPIAVLMAAPPPRYGWLFAVLAGYSILFHCVATAGGAGAHEYLHNPVREFLLPSVLRGNVRPNWCTLAGMSSGMSMVVYIAVLGGGLILFFLSGCGGYEVCSGDKVLRMLWWLCAAVAAAMLVLFVLFRTEETAYRYAVIGHSYDWGGDDEMAIANFQKSLQLDPNNPLVSNDLSLIMMRRAGHGDPKKGTGR